MAGWVRFLKEPYKVAWHWHIASINFYYPHEILPLLQTHISGNSFCIEQGSGKRIQTKEPHSTTKGNSFIWFVCNKLGVLRVQSNEGVYSVLSSIWKRCLICIYCYCSIVEKYVRLENMVLWSEGERGRGMCLLWLMRVYNILFTDWRRQFNHVYQSGNVRFDWN